MSSDFDTAYGVVAVEAGENFMVREAVFLLNGGTFRSPCTDDLVVVLLVLEMGGVQPWVYRKTLTSLSLTGTDS